MWLRLSPEGVRVLDDWRARWNPSEQDQRLVAEVLWIIARREWYKSWYSYSDISDTSIVVIEPRPGLTVHVRLWTGEDEQFDLVRILDEPRPRRGGGGRGGGVTASRMSWLFGPSGVRGGS